MISFAIPGNLDLPTGGYAYGRRILSEWKKMGIASKVIPLCGSFPSPTDAALEQSAAALSGAGPFLIDGLAYGAFSEGLAKTIGPKSIALVHHPLCDEQGLSASATMFLEQRERTALRSAAGVIATSPMTARDLSERFGVSAVTIAIPGTDPAPRAPIAATTPNILSVGTVTPRKGYGLLVDALKACGDLDWTCEIVGADDRDKTETTRIHAVIEAASLTDRITLRGTIDDVGACYMTADLFVSSSLHEGYGMAVVEAMAHGVPVITSTAGALKETAPVAKLIEPGDADALATALRPLIADRAARQKLGAQCRTFAESLPGWDETARRVAQAVDKIR